MVYEPSVTVIVPVWNGEATIAVTIQSLLGQSYPRDAVQIIVVDNGSSDDTIAVASAVAGVTVLRQDKPGSYAARNKGLDYAVGEYIAFIDADCIADRLWLETAVNVLRADLSVGIIAGHVEVIHHARGSRSAYLIERELSFRQEEAARKGTSVTANWVSPHKVLRDGGRFSESVKSGGDWLLSSKISALGYKVVYVPGAIVYHPSRDDIWAILSKRRRVSGGVWARRTVGLPRLIRSEVAGAVQRLRRVSAAPSLSGKDKVSLIPIVVAMTVVSIAELTRLAMGGRPRRS